MHHRTVALSGVVAAALWLLAFILSAVGTLLLARGHLEAALALYAHDMLAIGGAVAVTMRSCMDRSLRSVLNHIEIAQDMAPTPLRRSR